MDNLQPEQEVLSAETLAGHHVDVVGGGRLGGPILYCLAKMGFGVSNRLTLTDFDRCKPHNLATQWFLPGHALRGCQKVEAIAETIELLCDRQITTFDARFTGTEDRLLGPIVILAVDSLLERRKIWSGLKRRSEPIFLIDARVGLEMLEVFCADLGRDALEPYERSLEGEGDANDGDCRRAAFFYTTLGAAAYVGRLVRARVLGEPCPRWAAFDFNGFLLAARWDKDAPRGGVPRVVERAE
jgi:molybdopterin/thiamine biosynthesis adenylyltransferase